MTILRGLFYCMIAFLEKSATICFTYAPSTNVHQFFCNLVRNFVVEPSSGSCWKMTRGVPIISWREEALLLSVLLLLFPQLFHTSLTGKCRSQKQIGRYIVYISMYDIATKVVMRTHALCIPTRPYNLGFQKHLQTLRLAQKKSFFFFKKNFCIAECSFAFDEIIVSVSHYIYPKKKTILQ